MEKKLTRVFPALVAVLVGLGLATWRLANADWDPVALAELGTRFSQADPDGTEGYDGQFSYYLALDPDPSTVSVLLDNAPYRYQRIVYPLLARGLSFGQPQVVPWMLLLINVVAHGLGTYGFGLLLRRYGKSGWYALIYGCWVGMIGPLVLDMPEPLAFMLAVFSILCFLQGRTLLSALLMTTAVFTREALLLFMAAMLVASLIRRDRPGSFWMAAGLAAFGLWQIWLKTTFGEFGLGTGGAGDSGIEWIPLMGLLRIAEESLAVLGLFALIFGPSVVLPAVWGLYAAVVDLKGRRSNLEGWLLLANSAAILFLPFSTFREPLALVRLANGLVVSLVLFAANKDLSRPLNFGMFWIVYLVLLVQ